MQLSELATLLDVQPRDVGDAAPSTAHDWDTIRVADVEHDSRRVGLGALFACIRGEALDGHDFADEAVAAGACALLAERAIPSKVPLLLVDSVREAVGFAAAAVHGNPSGSLDLVGVTGTNGKTTTVRLVTGLLRSAGRHPLEIGTLTGTLTTPESTELQRTLAEAVDRGLDAAAMEVSSHALAQHRLNGCRFRIAAFTNLGRDHLDYHKTMEDYFGVKAGLFNRGFAQAAVVDVTAGWGRRLADMAASEMDVIEVDQRDMQLLAADHHSNTFRWRGQTVTLPLAGAFNRCNAVIAAEIAVALGMSPTDVAAGLTQAAQVPGRFEPVRAGQDFAVIVDYAHTPDALDAALQAARNLTERRLIVVFGAGGDRDRGKRSEMGTVAERSADHVIVTSDNPRSEDPETIIDEIVSGMSRAPDMCEPDRRLALRCALSMARRGDTLLVAGKGHETSQTIAGCEYEFDDRVVVDEELRSLLEDCRREGATR